MSLAKIGQRLSQLKANNPEKAGLITFPIGALYCAYEAERANFTDRILIDSRWRNELDNALSAERDIGRNQRPSKSSWTSIVHFNSALIRIDVGFERLIKHVTKCTSSRYPALKAEAIKHGISKKYLLHWDKVRTNEVNKLKHSNPSSLTKQRINYREMLKALEALVELLEAKL